MRKLFQKTMSAEDEKEFKPAPVDLSEDLKEQHQLTTMGRRAP